MKSFFLMLMVSICPISSFVGPGPSIYYKTSPLRDAKGDPLRENTGIRPSLHPTTINAIADALKQRATGTLALEPGDVEPLQIAINAGQIANEFLTRRRETSKEDGMAFDQLEEQTITGRVIGVVIRFPDLEKDLFNRASGVSWVKKYNDWESFGVLEDESGVKERIKIDPLFAMTRAECLLAIFLETVEAPTLNAVNQTVPGGSGIDFIDEDRKAVLSSTVE